MSAYLMVSLHANTLNPTNSSDKGDKASSIAAKFSTHDWWDAGTGWKNLLNNLRLVLQPFVMFNLLKSWLKVFPIPQLSVGFYRLMALMNHFSSAIPVPQLGEEFLFSCA